VIGPEAAACGTNRIWPSSTGERPAYRSPPPALGAHSAEILAEAGYSEQEVSAMAAEGIIRVA
jgi:crotonobetainyl-CoA:carnitine CoA-transferase CaiB-like acyl-CoA transferase